LRRRRWQPPDDEVGHRRGRAAAQRHDAHVRIERRQPGHRERVQRAGGHLLLDGRMRRGQHQVAGEGDVLQRLHVVALQRHGRFDRRIVGGEQACDDGAHPLGQAHRCDPVAPDLLQAHRLAARERVPRTHVEAARLVP